MRQELFKVPLISYKYKIILQVLAVVSYVLADMPIANIRIPIGGNIKEVSKIMFLVVSFLLLISKYKIDDEMIYLMRFRSLVYALMIVVLISVMLRILVPEATNYHRYDSLVLVFVMYFTFQFIYLKASKNEK